jgi:L-aspartate oxidase
MTSMHLRDLPRGEVTWERDADVVVVGAGAAGMSAALEASAGGRNVVLVCKAGLGGGSTPLAQGGLAAVLDSSDSTALHVRDTLVAGAGLCDEGPVSDLVAAAPGEIAWLRTLGARFDDGELGLEGGHSRRRVIHAGGDASGAEVHRVLSAALRSGAPEVVEHTIALDVVLDDAGAVRALRVGRIGDDGQSLGTGVIHTAAVVLAAGGYGQAYATTTNTPGATGDGVALAARAGAEISDIEFVQFHPTVLSQPGGRGQQPLVTEALRGAGATLVDADGRSVMAGHHPLGDLAPRDVVAATMHQRMTDGDNPLPHLWLDATAIGRQQLESEFPTVTAACRARGIDPVTEPIPVAPGAHYACGGIRADLDGLTSIDGLYAVGEVAATGVHGANRLASNSLTEALTAGRRVGRLLGSQPPVRPTPTGADQPERSRRAAPAESPGRSSRVIGARAADRAAAAEAMSRYAGVMRDAAGLEHLIAILTAAPDAPDALDVATVEATNLHTVSMLVAFAALTRVESRGCHRRSDAPATAAQWGNHLGMRWNGERVELRVAASI